MSVTNNYICFDLEGPLSPQDNAYELMKLIPDGDKVFEVISRYDDLLALANKEPIVMAGPVILKTAERNNASIIPVDSEHSALFFLLNGREKKNVNRTTPVPTRRKTRTAIYSPIL